MQTIIQALWTALWWVVTTVFSILWWALSTVASILYYVGPDLGRYSPALWGPTEYFILCAVAGGIVWPLVKIVGFFSLLSKAVK